MRGLNTNCCHMIYVMPEAVVFFVLHHVTRFIYTMYDTNITTCTNWIYKHTDINITANNYGNVRKTCEKSLKGFYYILARCHFQSQFLFCFYSKKLHVPLFTICFIDTLSTFKNCCSSVHFRDKTNVSMYKMSYNIVIGNAFQKGL